MNDPEIPGDMKRCYQNTLRAVVSVAIDVLPIDCTLDFWRLLLEEDPFRVDQITSNSANKLRSNL